MYSEVTATVRFILRLMKKQTLPRASNTILQATHKNKVYLRSFKYLVLVSNHKQEKEKVWKELSAIVRMCLLVPKANVISKNSMKEVKGMHV